MGPSAAGTGANANVQGTEQVAGFLERTAISVLQITNAFNQAQAIRAQVKMLEEQIAAFQAQVEELTGKNAEFEAQVKTLKEQIAAFQAQVQGLTEDNASKNDEIHALRGQVAEINKRNAALIEASLVAARITTARSSRDGAKHDRTDAKQAESENQGESANAINSGAKQAESENQGESANAINSGAKQAESDANTSKDAKKGSKDANKSKDAKKSSKDANTSNDAKKSGKPANTSNDAKKSGKPAANKGSKDAKESDKPASKSESAAKPGAANAIKLVKGSWGHLDPLRNDATPDQMKNHICRILRCMGSVKVADKLASDGEFKNYEDLIARVSELVGNDNTHLREIFDNSIADSDDKYMLHSRYAFAILISLLMTKAPTGAKSNLNC